MPPKKIHLVFKTHLDIGFTEHAEKVRLLYHERFIPQALATAEHFHAENPEAPKFVWTTGAWLIWDHLASRPAKEVKRLEVAIEKGLIRWHGLPFTLHSELMSPALFRAGLSYAQELDRRFGMTTVAAKMTDVPGHTRGIVPLLAEAGIRFLHIGVNTASPPPDVPDIFRWRAPEGEEVMVMYQRSYGETHIPEGMEDGLSFAHTNDNMGPQQIHQTVEVHRALRHRFPETEIEAATMEDFGRLLWDRRDRFPVLERELGDSWIHGAGSDPAKMARFRSLQRLYDELAGERMTGSRQAFGRGLAIVAEHTWGVDIKTFLRDEKAWDRTEFEAARKSDNRFAYSEASWAEQRAYLDAAVAALDDEDAGRAAAALADAAVPAAPEDMGPLPDTDTICVGEWLMAFDRETGDILSITAPGGQALAGRAGALLGYVHESYDAADMARHLDTYLTHTPEWAVLDHDKPGLDRARTARSAVWQPIPTGMAQGKTSTSLMLEMPDAAHDALGAPRQVEYRFAPDGGALVVSVILRQKPANRMPEAGFLAFAPKASDWSFLKTGLWQPAGAVVTRGGAALQAVFAARARLADGKRLIVTPLDTPLTAPAGHPFMEFPVEPPSFEQGLRFNLYNNKWGTNFPMWWEGDLMARFRIEVENSSNSSLV